MRQKHKNSLRFPFQVILGIVVIGLLVSACSLPGSSTNNNTTGITPTASAQSRPVATQPKATGKLPAGKPLPADEVKPLTFNLVYNDAAMDQAVLQMYTPGSASFHQFLMPEQIAQGFGLGNSPLQLVQNWLSQNGYTIVETDALHTAIKVQATVATIERTLNIQLDEFSIQGHEFFMQQGTPTLPASVSPYVDSIQGLDNFAVPEFKPPFSFAAQSGALAADCSKYGAKQTLTRNKIAAAYQINQLYQHNLQGQNMSIAVAEFGDSYNPADVANYDACVGIAPPTIQNIDVDGHLASSSGEGEAALDLELISGLAPQAQIFDYQTDSNTAFAQALVDVFTRVATDDKVQVLSVSYGTREDAFSTSEMRAVNRSLRTLAAEGISVFISSGDCGAFTPRLHDIAQVSFPASAPYAIAVGGTHLQVNDNNIRTSENVWGADDGAPVCMNEWGSGGGVSQNSDFVRPGWQVGPGTTKHYDGSQAGVVVSPFPPPQAVSAPNGLRQVPDVAAAAYPNIAIYYKGTWIASGGTSAAAPIMAAGILLVDQGLKQQGKALLGGVPQFYTLANHPGNFHPYTDITSGNNLFYPATQGWDYATGWGSPNFNDMLQVELSE